MARRFGWLTGSAGIGLALWRLTRLLQPQAEGPAWQVVLAAATVLGIVVTWTARSYRLSPALTAALNVAGASLAAIRVTAPSTLVLGIIPTADTFPELGLEVGFAVELIRFGAAPVLPVAGLVAILSLVFWTLGALLVIGSMNDNRALAVLPGVAFYLQLATLDRRPPGTIWTVAFVVVAALAMLTLAPGADRTSGRVVDRDGRLLDRRSRTAPGISFGVMATVALLASSVFAGTVPESGVLQWRNRSGIGSGLYGGGASFNLFVGLQQSLVSLSERPMFYARVSESAPDNDELYWKLITLDTFDGENWIPSAQEFSKQGRSRWERSDLAFVGPTVPVNARIRIDSFADQILPTLYSPTSLESDVGLISQSFRVREDGSVAIDVTSRRGWEYQISSEIPRPDLSVLASSGGELTPIFAEAAEAGEIDIDPADVVPTDEPDDVEDYLELPDDLDGSISALAREVTADGTGRFERALLLESWFRDTGGFTYSVDVSTGHSALDLADWLVDEDSNNYRTGYCEQFATAMAVIARSLGIPTRVVLGFTPGDVETQPDGSEIIVVRERNAHAWVELWMLGQGWVRFDPTPRADGVNPSLTEASVDFDLTAFVPAPEEPDALDSSQPGATERPDPFGPEVDVTGGDATPDLRLGEGFRVPTFVWWILSGLGVAGIVPGIKAVRARRRLSRIRTGDVTAAWEDIVDRLTDLGVGIDPSLTPSELARQQDPSMVPLASMYSARIYGGVRRGDGRSAYASARSSLDRRFATSQRVYSWFVPTSLRRR